MTDIYMTKHDMEDDCIDDWGELSWIVHGMVWLMVNGEHVGFFDDTPIL